MTKLIDKIENQTSVETIFIDFFDTIVHRTVHPNYSIKIWGKLLIRELAIEATPDDLFEIRLDSLSHLAKKNKQNILEVPYDILVREVYVRLVNSARLRKIDFKLFQETFEQADYISEISVQFKNDIRVSTLKQAKQKGYRIYLITDFFFSKNLMKRILKHHQIFDLFDDVFVSSDVSKSKENGSIYPFLLEKLNIEAEKVVMIGDNQNSDVTKAGLHKVSSLRTKNLSHHRRNKKNLLGKDETDFTKSCAKIEKRCQKSGYQFSEYVIYFYFFTERLYKRAIKDGVFDLYFLAREGLYLKKLFDLYQELNQFSKEVKIKTHYLKASRQSAQKLSLKPLEEEKFIGFARTHGQMSIKHLFEWFKFDEETQAKIISDTKLDPDIIHANIFDSEAFITLRGDTSFKEAYKAIRISQKDSFYKYLDSFETNYREEGIALVDVGWGGTMQESLYDFLGQEVPVTGYYIGLKEIYNILPDTNRYGLNFSIYPFKNLSFDILKANGQLYEQLLAAPHGSTLAYCVENGIPSTIEFHEENEKYIFDTYISEIQDYMLLEFEKMFIKLRSINYSEDMVQGYMTDMALRVGIFTNKKKIEFINNLSKGFYQNVGENKVGLAYSPSQLKSQKRALLITFIRSPEKIFRYLVKVKPYMYAKGLYWLSSPLNLTYYYIKFNFWIKKKWFPKNLLR